MFEWLFECTLTNGATVERTRVHKPPRQHSIITRQSSQAKAFVLVGDHYQLPPLVSNRAAQEAGLGNSLFRVLAEAHPQSVVPLTRQYRMAQDIMDVANTLVYDGAMHCGAAAVAAATLCVPGKAPVSLLQAHSWLKHVRRGNVLACCLCRIAHIDTMNGWCVHALTARCWSHFRGCCLLTPCRCWSGRQATRCATPGRRA